MSTCEAEVAAAALSFQVVEGLRAMLVEWGVVLSTPILLVDNQSALTVLEKGCTRRTRYFAVRAARIGHEMAIGNVDARCLPNSCNGADGLTNMGAADLLRKLRLVMEGQLPDRPG